MPDTDDKSEHRELLKRIVSLKDRQHDAYFSSVRTQLTLAAGSLAVLVALPPQTDTTALAFPLQCALCLLALSILLGSIILAGETYHWKATMVLDGLLRSEIPSALIPELGSSLGVRLKVSPDCEIVYPFPQRIARCLLPWTFPASYAMLAFSEISKIHASLSTPFISF